MRITRKAIALPGLLLAVGAFAATGIAASNPGTAPLPIPATGTNETAGQPFEGICSANLRRDTADYPASVQVNAQVMATWDATASEADARSALKQIADGEVRCETGPAALGVPHGEVEVFEMPEGELPEELKDLIPEDGGSFVVPDDLADLLPEDGAKPGSRVEVAPEGELPEELKDLIAADGGSFVVPGDIDGFPEGGIDGPAGVFVAEIDAEKLGVTPADGVDVFGFVDALYEKDADADAARTIVRDLSGNEPERISGDEILGEVIVGDCPEHEGADDTTPAPEAR